MGFALVKIMATKQIILRGTVTQTAMNTIKYENIKVAENTIKNVALTEVILNPSIPTTVAATLVMVEALALTGKKSPTSCDITESDAVLPRANTNYVNDLKAHGPWVWTGLAGVGKSEDGYYVTIAVNSANETALRNVKYKIVLYIEI